MKEINISNTILEKIKNNITVMDSKVNVESLQKYRNPYNQVINKA